MIESHKHSCSRRLELHGTNNSNCSPICFHVARQKKQLDSMLTHWLSPNILLNTSVLSLPCKNTYTSRISTSTASYIAIVHWILPTASISQRSKHTILPFFFEPRSKVNLMFLGNCKTSAFFSSLSVVPWVDWTTCLCFNFCRTKTGQ